MTMATSAAGATQAHSYLFYLNEAGLDAAFTTNLVFARGGAPNASVQKCVCNRCSRRGPVRDTVHRYDGGTHGGTAWVIGAGSLSQSLTVHFVGRNGTTYASSTTAPTDAGDYSASASFAGDANHTGSTDSQDFSIARATPTATLEVTNSPIPYDSLGHAATVDITNSSVPGSVMDILTGGLATQTNADTYAVTADFVLADLTNYNTLGSLAAGDFIIAKAGQPTLSVTGPESITYGTTATITTLGGFGTGALSFAAGSSTGCTVHPTSGEISVTNASGTCAVTASKAGDSNYNLTTSDGYTVILVKAAGSVSISNLPDSPV